MAEFKDMQKVYQLEREIEECMMRTYSCSYSREYCSNAVSNQLAAIVAATDGNPKGKLIVDLGCGSTIPTEGDGREFEPWLCRMLYAGGSIPIGVDLGCLDDELFLGYQRDLWQPDALDCIPAKSADVVHAGRLFSSSYVRGDEEALQKILHPQLYRILKPEGVTLL